MTEAHPYAIHVAKLLKEAGFPSVKLEHKVEKALWKTAGRGFIPFDVSYVSLNPPHREYFECKYHGHETREEEVAKFLLDLQTCNIPIHRGALVTNQGYSPLAKDFATKAGLRLYLLPTEKNSTPRQRSLQRFLSGIHQTLKGNIPLPHAFIPIN